MKDTPGTSPQFAREESTSDSLAWRKAADVLVNLNQYVFHQSLVLIIQGAKRQHQANQRQKRRPRVQRPSQLEAPRKGIIVVCAGLGVMADSCVERGFANIIATCDGNDLCRQLLQTRHPSANHYGDLKEVAEEVWDKYRWDQARSSETAYILMGELQLASDSAIDRRERHMVQMAQILQSPLVIIESTPRLIKSELRNTLHALWKSIGYSVVHMETIEHSQLGGATNQKRTYIWFQKDSMGPTREFPRIPQPGLFMTPQTVIRDVLNPWRHNLNPSPVQSGMTWDTPLSFEVGQPAREGHVTGTSCTATIVHSIDGISPYTYRCLIRLPKEGGGR